MLREVLRSKIHRCTITDANLNYEGSITIDSQLMELTDLREYDKVQVVDLNNGERFETYVITGKPGSGEICVNGAAARLVQIGDILIIMAYGFVSDAERGPHKPRVVNVNAKNHPLD